MVGEAIHIADQEFGAPVLRVSADVRTLLRCPACRGLVVEAGNELSCVIPDCGMRFPVVDGAPVLINDRKSLFLRKDLIEREGGAFNPRRPRFKEWMDQHLPALGKNFKSKDNFQLLAELLLQRSLRPRVLVIGGRITGQGLEALLSCSGLQLVETDVNFGPRTQLICDAHSLPFADHSFDAVVVQGVLQYVPDPRQCVQEIERVLKPGGLIYSETAFMQQVVHGRFDFTRFTHLGVRRLFNKFWEVRSGPVGGPGMALGWAAHFFLLSFVTSRSLRCLMHAVARLTLFWLKYFDAWLIERPGSYDAASGFFFLGERGDCCLTDRELVRMYRGAQQ